MANPPAEHANPLRERLLPGEHVLWEGQPDRRAYMFGGSPWVVPFTILWAAFAIFWEWTAYSSGAPAPFLVWGLAFVVIGVYLVAVRFVVAGREAARTWYALTDRRVLIRRGAFRSRYTELDLVSLPAPELDDSATGIGTIWFGPVNAGARVLGPSWPGSRMGPAMIAVPRATLVFRKIAEARASALAETTVRR